MTVLEQLILAIHENKLLVKSSLFTVKAVLENAMSPTPSPHPPGKAFFILNIMWVVVFEIPKCKGECCSNLFLFLSLVGINNKCCSLGVGVEGGTYYFLEQP